MKKAFGKRKKTPEMNANCYLYAAHQAIEASGELGKKDLARLKKYQNRLFEIVSGQYEPIPNTFANLLKIANEFKECPQLRVILLGT